MMAWRIATDTPTYTADDLSGAGAKSSGGRWNRPGIPLVYASSSIALACLETIVHLRAESLPLNRYLVEIHIPDKVMECIRLVGDFRNEADMVGWDAEPPGMVSLDVGLEWIISKDSAILQVPSVIIPEESNYLINPSHPGASWITAHKVRRFLYDSRLG